MQLVCSIELLCGVCVVELIGAREKGPSGVHGAGAGRTRCSVTVRWLAHHALTASWCCREMFQEQGCSRGWGMETLCCRCSPGQPRKGECFGRASRLRYGVKAERAQRDRIWGWAGVTGRVYFCRGRSADGLGRIRPRVQLGWLGRAT